MFFEISKKIISKNSRVTDSQSFEARFRENGLSGPQNGLCRISPKLEEIRKKFKGRKLCKKP